MTKTTAIHLGYQVGDGEPIAIPLKHLCVSGQTQESGKTTTLEALVSRSELRAIAFITKRGERSFTVGRRIAPFFQERADWEFVQSILEATMRERMKFERAWIVRATKGARTLADVQENIRTLQEKSKRAMDKDLYMLLGEYLDKVVPLIQRLPKVASLELERGLNVMDLRAYPEELQSLVIGSAVRWIHQHESQVITIVPEAWKFAPQSRNTPVKLELRKLIREGAGLRNYLWIDSQDLAGVEKELLRGAAVWLLGVQREANELQRALDNIPRGIRHPTAAAIAQLKLGEFYACWGEQVHKVYVQPAWLPEDLALRVAKGKLSVQDVAAECAPAQIEEGDNAMDWQKMYESEKIQREALDQTVGVLRAELAALRQVDRPKQRETETAPRVHSVAGTLDNEQLYQALKKRLMDEAPVLLKVVAHRPEIQVQVQVRTISMDDSTIKGKIAVLIAEDWFDHHPRSAPDVQQELIRRGLPPKTPGVRIWEAMKDLSAMGFFFVGTDKKYTANPDAKVNVMRSAHGD